MAVPVFQRILQSVIVGLCLLAAMPAPAEQTQPCDMATLASLRDHYRLQNLYPGIDGADGVGTLVDSVCKVWPYDESILLAAVVHSQSAVDLGIGERELGLIVGMLDRSSQRVLGGYTVTIEEDAVTALQEGSLRLDTARYDLAPGVRAFGVVMHSSARGPSCPERWPNDELRLLVRDGSRLRQVFSTYLTEWRLVSGGTCGMGAAEGSVQEEADIGIGVERTRSHGYADLRLIAGVERTETPPEVEGGYADATISTRRASRLVHYDGGKYLPEGSDNLSFWADDKR